MAVNINNILTFSLRKDIAKLRQVLAQEDTILFIGSGISMWSGLPSWTSMIEELAKFIESSGMNADLVRAEAVKGDLLQAASYGFAKLTKQQIGDFVRAACRYGGAKPQEIHHKIVTLGPRCFVTTNYDNLIEESLRIWQPDRFFRPPITNRQLTEMAEIIHARSIDFIYKPHGDAADSDSIILTREQYRQLLPQGERQAALDALKMLLASRPVVYLGFGLRDPDFIYLRDLLANTYKGGIRDHYALMADVSEEENDYWRGSYGIHLVSYNTVERPDKTRDHKELLTLLDDLTKKEPVSPAVVGFNPCTSDVILSLARHAAGLSRAPRSNPEFQIRVHAKTKKLTDYNTYYPIYKFEHYVIDKFLDEGPDRAILIGLPGAGKTYSLRQAAVRLAEKLHEICLSEPFDQKEVVVPILVDLKMYRGDLVKLVDATLPRSLSLKEITRHFKVKIFFDSFNEMPKEYWEKGSYESDFENFFRSEGSASIIVCSRTNDGLSRLDLPLYYLDQIDEESVTAELNRLGIESVGPFDREIRWLLQRPFYFQYISSGAVRLPAKAQPRDFYQALFKNLSKEFSRISSEPIDIKNVLARVAYKSLDMGEEAFQLSELLDVLKNNGETAGLTDDGARDIANWLVSASVLIPYSGGRIAFVHQSVTEYLAAVKLAQEYQANPNNLKQKLTLTRWDQAIFLTLSLLPLDQGEEFLQDLINADFSLALNAAKYIENGREEIVSKLLEEIPKRREPPGLFNHGIDSAVKYGLPISLNHESKLRTLIKCGGSLGAAALSRLVELKGEEVKDEMLELLVEYHGDYNLCRNGIAPSLRQFATVDDAKKIVSWADSMQKILQDSEDNIIGFTSGAAEYLVNFDLSVVQREFLPEDEMLDNYKIRMQIVSQILRDHHSTAALDFAGDLLLKGYSDATVAIYFISRFAKDDCELSWMSFTVEHLDRINTIICDDGDKWALKALERLCSARPDLREVVRQRAFRKFGIEKAALLYCVTPNDFTQVFLALEELILMSSENRCEQPVSIFEGIDFDWTSKEELFVHLLKLRDMRIASALLGGACPPIVPNLGKLEIGPIEWWLEWMLEKLQEDSTDGYWFVERLAGLFGSHLSREVQDEFIAEFNKPDSKFRRLLLKFVLPHCSDITTDVFSEDAISYMLTDLSHERHSFSYRGHLLGFIATEQFVTEHILPLLQDAKPPLLDNLHIVLRQAGSRHGRRYALETDLKT